MAETKVNLYNIRYKDSMKQIDWKYYTKFYPEKTKAIQMLRLDTGLSLKDAKDVVDEIFRRLEQGEVEKRPSNQETSSHWDNASYDDDALQYNDISYKEDLKRAGKVTGCCLFGIFYLIIGVIAELTKSYSGKKRR